MNSTQTPIETGRYYHLYNHSNIGFDLFRNHENDKFFLQKYSKGNLYYQKIRRKEIVTEDYLFQLIGYIHLNPLKHGFVKSPEKWPFSSYEAYLTDKENLINRNSIIDLFGGKDNFLIYHDLKKADAFAEENDLEY